MTALPLRSDVDAAAEVLGDDIRATPVLTISGSELGLSPEVRLHCKLEFLQHSGTFKGRGALHAARRALADDPHLEQVGFIAASGGNHGAAVAWAAQRLGVPAEIFVPTISAPAKVERLHDYGATVRQVGAVYAEALQASRERQRETGAASIHAYDQFETLAGAATLAREFDQQIPNLDAIVVSCGGGGLAAGLACWFGAGVELAICETPGTAAFARAVECGEPVPVEVSGIAADALGATQIGNLPWTALSSVDSRPVLIPDDEVVAAQDWLWTNLRILVEPSAAAPIAALRTRGWEPRGHRNIGVVICGANLAR